MKIDILTLFPNMFPAVINDSILGRAIQNDLLKINLVNIRDFSENKHNKTDEYPFGGGAGMVMTAQPIFDSLKAVNADTKKIFYMSPRGKTVDKEKLLDMAKNPEIVMLCGHYEGIDQRVLDYWNVEELSIGDIILTGGELAAMVLIDAMARLIPGVLGSEESHLEESIYSGLLEYNQYTRPAKYEGLEVPEVLISGHHENIYLWRFENSLYNTYKNRRDLFDKFIENKENLTKLEQKVLNKMLKTVNENEKKL